MNAGKSKDAERYERPGCWLLTRTQILQGTTEDFARWRAEALQVQERNAARCQARCAAKRTIEALIAQAWPRGSDSFKAMTRALTKASIESPQDYLRMLEDFERDAAKQNKEALMKTAREKSAAHKLLAAGAFLSARGKAVGVDYQPHEAVDMANEIAVDEAIYAQKERGGFVTFDGDGECEGGCRGWDMASQRCDCGVNRVSWESDGDFEDVRVYAHSC